MNTAEIPQNQRGIYDKFIVTRTDRDDAPGGKHEHSQYFVLNLSTDKHAIAAASTYAKSCAEQYPALAKDLRDIIASKIAADDEYIDVSETVFPDGRVVPAFTVAKYIAGRGFTDAPVSTADAEPWVAINYNDAKQAAEDAGLALLTASQSAAIAWQIINQDENWTGGKVGEGSVYMGLHNDTVDEAQQGAYESEDPKERRWHVLANGDRIYDFAGNAYQWMFDDLHGDENGLIGSAGIPADSPLLTLPPYPSMEKGMGWRPDGTAKWSGRALVRGGCWGSDGSAGVFNLNRYWPDGGDGVVGFRCTKGL